MPEQLGIFANQNKDKKHRIETLRRLISVHSCIYYRLSSSLISDREFDKLCAELTSTTRRKP